ncbi:hypothetical protein Droror1_Dr00022560 [Drosera rotundifolia]
MKSLFRPIIRMINPSISLPKPTKESFIRRHQISATSASAHDVIASICDSLRKGTNWDNLNSKYDSVDLDSVMVEQVLLQFKEPAEAKRALKFFHWASRSKNFEHGIRSYSIAIHILSRARLVDDARALLESVVSKNGGIRVVGSLMGTYRVMNSSPFVFDLLVQCCSKLRMFEVAFDVCCYLDQHGFWLSLVTFNTLLHVIQKASDVNHMVWKVYEHMVEKRVYPNEATVRIMTSALCKEGELQKVVDVVDRINGKRCSPMVIVNTSLILRMMEQGNVEKGMLLMKRLLQKNMIFDTISFSLIVFATVKKGELKSAWEVYQEMLNRGFKTNSFVHTLFIGGYCKRGLVDEASNLMQEMRNMDLKPYEETYNHLIAGCAKAEKVDDGKRFCEEMLKGGLVPDCSSFNLILERMCYSRNVTQGNEMLTLAIEKGFSPNEITYSHLIEGYNNEGNLDEALKLYYEVEYKSLSPGLSIFSALIQVLCKHGKPEEADRYLDKIKGQSIRADVSAYKALIAGHLKKGNKERADILHDEMVLRS